MPKRAVGLDFSGTYTRIARATGSRMSGCKMHDLRTADTPNVAVLPRTPSERPRAGRHTFREAWGRGLKPGSPNGQSLARVPAWLTWRALGTNETVRPAWNYCNAFGEKSETELQEIVRSLALGPENTGEGQDGLKIVPIPDYFRERAQENLLRALPWSPSNVRLLWRSVAAVLAHMYKFNNEIFDGRNLAVVDVGNCEVSVTVLELRAERYAGRTYIVPKRDLPEENRFRRWPVVPFDWSLCSALLQDTMSSPGFPEIWQILSGESAVQSIASRLHDRQEERLLLQEGERWREVTFAAPRVLAAARRVLFDGCETDDSPLWKRVEQSGAVDPPKDRHSYSHVLSELLPRWLSDLDDAPNLAIVCGSIADVHVGGDRPFAEHTADWLIDGSPLGEVLYGVDGNAGPGSTVAVGCSVYGVREQTGLPTYLDTLPHFYIRGTNSKGKRVRLDLLGTREVRGGKVYQNELQDAALIHSGSDEVTFRLEREGEKKRLKQTFRETPSQDCRLSLHAEVQPAQGFARVRIVPELDDLFRGQEVTLEWDRMEPEPEEEEDKAAVPPCWPIEAEGEARSYARPHIQNYTRAVMDEDWWRARRLVKRLGQQMQSGRAYGSHPNEYVANRVRKALTRHYQAHGRELLTEYLRKEKKGRLQQIKDLIRAATALFTETPDWARNFLREELKRALAKQPKDPNPEVVFLNAMGRCFSRPEEVETFLECMKRKFRTRIQDYHRLNSRKTLGMLYWCKALQLILRLNEDAVDQMDRSDAETLARYLEVQLDVEVKRKGLEEPGVSTPYKNTLLSICFLLRIRRQYENFGFLSDWKVMGSTAGKICANLRKTAQPPTRWRPRSSSLASDECLQEALIRYIESRATRRDIEIIKEGHEEIAGD